MSDVQFTGHVDVSFEIIFRDSQCIAGWFPKLKTTDGELIYLLLEDDETLIYEKSQAEALRVGREFYKKWAHKHATKKEMAE